MPQIEVDFDVFKEITYRRAAEDVTPNDVLRELLQLPKAPKRSATIDGEPWIVSDTRFPAGTQFRAHYKGKAYTGVVKGAGLELSDGHRFPTPSAAAMHITGNNVNGWRFWKCKIPGASEFVLLERIRAKSQ